MGQSHAARLEQEMELCERLLRLERTHGPMPRLHRRLVRQLEDIAEDTFGPYDAEQEEEEPDGGGGDQEPEKDHPLPFALIELRAAVQLSSECDALASETDREFYASLVRDWAAQRFERAAAAAATSKQSANGGCDTDNCSGAVVL